MNGGRSISPTQNSPYTGGGLASNLAAGRRSSTLLLLLFSAIGEEVTYRGLLLRYLTWLLRDPPIAVLASSLMFALAHSWLGDMQMLSAIWMGLVLGTFYVRRGSLVTVIIAHFLFNLLQVELLRLL
jgi:membrane protease YdiL (CAAX protease family)